MASAERPTGLVVPTKGRTSAVDERARARPSATDPLMLWPIMLSAKPISSAQSRSCAAPTPKTSRRIVHRRRKESSRPIANSRRTMPNSAKGLTASGLEMVM
jgi:hypothetical protein